MKIALLMSLVLFVAVAGGIWIWSRVGSSRRVATEQDGAENEQQNRTRKGVSAMASRNNARTDWEESVIKRNQLTRLFTFQVEDALVRDSKPILGFGSVDDITKQNGRYSVYFRDRLPGGPDIRFVLECSSQQVESILDGTCSGRGIPRSPSL